MGKRQKKSKRVFWIRLLSTMALLLVGTFGLYRYVASRALVQRIQAVRDAGYPIDMAELNDWYVTPEVNAADAYLRAFAAFPMNHETEEYSNLPEVGTPDVPLVLGEPLDPEMAERIEAYLTLHSDALMLIEEAALIRECRYPGEYREGIAHLLSPLHQLRRSARTLKLQSILDHDRGDHDLAAQRCISIIAVARSMENDPNLISALVSISIQDLAYEQIEMLASHGQVSDAQLGALAKAVEPIDIDQMFLRAFVGERCFVQDRLSHSETLTRVFSSNPTLGQMAVVFWRTSGLMDIDHGSSLDVMQAHIDFAEAPTWPTPAILEDIDGHIPRICVVTRHILPTLNYVYPRISESRRRTILAGIAVDRYRQKYGEFPAQLADLLPEFIDAVPLDPFDEKPLRYRIENTGTIIYSIGSDGIDDTGKLYNDDGDMYKPGSDIPFTFGGLQEKLWPQPEEEEDDWGYGGYGDPYGGGYGEPYAGGESVGDETDVVADSDDVAEPNDTGSDEEQ